MSGLDAVIVVIVLISAVIGLVRGFVKEAVALGTWIAAIWLAVIFSNDLAAMLPQALERASFSLGRTDFEIRNMRIGIAFTLLVVAALIAGAVLNHLLGKLTKAQVLRGADRVLGLIFGVARGLAIVLIIVLAAGLTEAPQSEWWRQARLIPPFELGATRALNLLPPDVAQHFSIGGKVSHKSAINRS